MGYTLAAALRQLRADAEVVVAELVPEVVRWNRSHLGHLAAFPLDDPRVKVHQGDIARLLRSARDEYDIILLDVDNGPEGLTRPGNDWLYGAAGLHCAALALREGGVLAVWSATPDRVFSARLERAGFEVEVFGGSARRDQDGARHTIWLAMPAEPAERSRSAP